MALFNKNEKPTKEERVEEKTLKFLNKYGIHHPSEVTLNALDNIAHDSNMNFFTSQFSFMTRWDSFEQAVMKNNLVAQKQNFALIAQQDEIIKQNDRIIDLLEKILDK